MGEAARWTPRSKLVKTTQKNYMYGKKNHALCAERLKALQPDATSHFNRSLRI